MTGILCLVSLTLGMHQEHEPAQCKCNANISWAVQMLCRYQLGHCCCLEDVQILAARLCINTTHSITLMA